MDGPGEPPRRRIVGATLAARKSGGLSALLTLWSPAVVRLQTHFLTSSKRKHYSSWVSSQRKARPGSNLCNSLQMRDEELGGERLPSSVCADLREH